MIVVLSFSSLSSQREGEGRGRRGEGGGEREEGRERRGEGGGERKEGREGKREDGREGKRKRKREDGREGKGEGKREDEREGKREDGREGKREGKSTSLLPPSPLLPTQGHLLLLVTDHGFLNEHGHVWEVLSNIEGDGDFIVSVEQSSRGIEHDVESINNLTFCTDHIEGGPRQRIERKSKCYYMYMMVWYMWRYIRVGGS